MCQRQAEGLLSEGSLALPCKLCKQSQASGVHPSGETHNEVLAMSLADMPLLTLHNRGGACTYLLCQVVPFELGEVLDAPQIIVVC